LIYWKGESKKGEQKIKSFDKKTKIEKIKKKQKKKKKKTKKKMIVGYKANAKNKKLQAELGVWEKISTLDVLIQTEKNERKKGKKT